MRLPLLLAAFSVFSGTLLDAEWAIDGSRLDRIDPLIEGAIEDGLIPGGSVLIQQGGETVKLDHFGALNAAGDPVDADTRFRLFSMTKPITIVAALILHERGAYFLDDKVSDVWPELGPFRAYVSGEGETMETEPAEPTIRNLMMHTSGLTYPWGPHPVAAALRDLELPMHGMSISELAQKIASVPLLFQPGERWNYGYSQDVLAGLVEHVAGEPFDVFVKREILDPLGMTRTAYQVPMSAKAHLIDNYRTTETGALERIEVGTESAYLKDDPVPWGGMGLAGPIEDYARFCQMLLNRGELDGQRIVSPLSVDAMLSNQMGPEIDSYEPKGTPFYRFSKGYGFGYGVKVLIDPVTLGNPSVAGEAAWSGAASTYFWVVPECDLAILFFTQNMNSMAVQPLSEKIKLAAYHSLIPKAE